MLCIFFTANGIVFNTHKRARRAEGGEAREVLLNHVPVSMYTQISITHGGIRVASSKRINTSISPRWRDVRVIAYKVNEEARFN